MGSNQRGSSWQVVERWKRGRQRPKKFKSVNRQYNSPTSVESFRKAIRNKKFSCMICHRSLKDQISLYVDHDHKTGLIRGVLCNRCNSGIALIDAGLLAPSLQYLERRDEEIKKGLESNPEFV